MVAADVIPQTAHNVAHLSVAALVNRQFRGELLARAAQTGVAAHGVFDVAITVQCQPRTGVTKTGRRRTAVKKLVETGINRRAKRQCDRAAEGTKSIGRTAVLYRPVAPRPEEIYFCLQAFGDAGVVAGLIFRQVLMGNFDGAVRHKPRVFANVLTPLIAKGVEFQAQPIRVIVAAEAGVLVTGAKAEEIILIGGGHRMLGGHVARIKIRGRLRHGRRHLNDFRFRFSSGFGGRGRFLNFFRCWRSLHRGDGGRRVGNGRRLNWRSGGGGCGRGGRSRCAGVRRGCCGCRCRRVAIENKTEYRDAKQQQQGD